MRDYLWFCGDFYCTRKVCKGHKDSQQIATAVSQIAATETAIISSRAASDDKAAMVLGGQRVLVDLCPEEIQPGTEVVALIPQPYPRTPHLEIVTARNAKGRGYTPPHGFRSVFLGDRFAPAVGVVVAWF